MNTMHEILREFPYALYVVGVKGRDPGEGNALLVSWLTQCSFEPPLLVMAVRRDTRSFELLREGQAFSVNVVDHEQKELARRFVKPAHRVGDKAGDDLQAGEKTGAPVLREALASVECRVRAITEPGDHAVIVGEVVSAVRRGSGRQLMCADMHWTYGG